MFPLTRVPFWVPIFDPQPCLSDMGLREKRAALFLLVLLCPRPQLAFGAFELARTQAKVVRERSTGTLVCLVGCTLALAMMGDHGSCCHGRLVVTR